MKIYQEQFFTSQFLSLKDICSEHGTVQNSYTKYLVFIFKHTIYSSFGVDITFQYTMSWEANTMNILLSDRVILGDNHFNLKSLTKKKKKKEIK